MNDALPSQAVEKSGRGWTRTIDPLITNISRSATKATRPNWKTIYLHRLMVRISRFHINISRKM